jgi:hypothetical protein
LTRLPLVHIEVITSYFDLKNLGDGDCLRQEREDGLDLLG